MLLLLSIYVLILLISNAFSVFDLRRDKSCCSILSKLTIISTIIYICITIVINNSRYYGHIYMTIGDHSNFNITSVLVIIIFFYYQNVFTRLILISSLCQQSGSLNMLGFYIFIESIYKIKMNIDRFIEFMYKIKITIQYKLYTRIQKLINIFALAYYFMIAIYKFLYLSKCYYFFINMYFIFMHLLYLGIQYLVIFTRNMLFADTLTLLKINLGLVIYFIYNTNIGPSFLCIFPLCILLFNNFIFISIVNLLIMYNKSSIQKKKLLDILLVILLCFVIALTCMYIN